MQKGKVVTWDDIVNLRLPVGRERLIGNYRSALTLIVLILTLYSLGRSIALASHIGYEVYQQEFDLVIGGRATLAFYWFCCFSLGILGLASKKYFIWRIALIAVGVGLGSWAGMFYINRGFRVFDSIHTYTAFSVLCLVIATMSHDPRPIRKLRESLEWKKLDKS